MHSLANGQADATTGTGNDKWSFSKTTTCKLEFVVRTKKFTRQNVI